MPQMAKQYVSGQTYFMSFPSAALMVGLLLHGQLWANTKVSW